MTPSKPPLSLLKHKSIFSPGKGVYTSRLPFYLFLFLGGADLEPGVYTSQFPFYAAAGPPETSPFRQEGMIAHVLFCRWPATSIFLCPLIHKRRPAG